MEETSVAATVDFEKENFPGDKEGLLVLPNTFSLPTLTVPTDCARLPHDNLSRVLRESERLIQSTHAGPAKKKVKSLDGFLKSLREDKQRAIVMDKNCDSQTKRIMRAHLSRGVLARKPKFSTENSSESILEIIVKDKEGEGEGDFEKRQKKAPSARMVRQMISPKIKKAGIVKLNEQLQLKINEQQKQQLLDQQFCGRGFRKPLETPTQSGIDEEEFGSSDREASEPDDGVISCEHDSELEFGLKLNGKDRAGRKVRVAVVKSDVEEDGYLNLQNFNLSAKPNLARNVKKILESQSETEELCIEQLIVDEECSRVQESFSYDLHRPNNGISQLLSGRFLEVNSQNEGEGDASEGGFGDDPANSGDDSENRTACSNDGYDPLKDSDDLEQNLKGTAGEMKSPYDKAVKISGLFDDEAEDEDSDVSADDLDEVAIAKELQDSNFLDEGEDEGYGGHQDQLAIHARMQREQEDLDMDILINRFLPQKSLEEKGAMAELWKKYAGGDEHEEADFAPAAGSFKKSQSKFGQIRVSCSAAPASSHPDFLKLLEHDLMSIESELEALEEDSGGESAESVGPAESVESAGYAAGTECRYDYQYKNEKNKQKFAGATTKIKQIDNTKNHQSGSVLLCPSNVKIQHGALTREPKVSQGMFENEQLRARLYLSGKEGADQASDHKKSHNTTFETISSRPIIPNDRLKK